MDSNLYMIRLRSIGNLYRALTEKYGQEQQLPASPRLITDSSPMLGMFPNRGWSDSQTLLAYDGSYGITTYVDRATMVKINSLFDARQREVEREKARQERAVPKGY